MSCHFKRALELLISDSLTLEKLLGHLEGKASAYKRRKAVYGYWLQLFELSYESFIWIASNHDRSNVLKHYKGPKHGALAKQKSGRRSTWRIRCGSHDGPITRFIRSDKPHLAQVRPLVKHTNAAVCCADSFSGLESNTEHLFLSVVWDASKYLQTSGLFAGCDTTAPGHPTTRSQ